MPIQQAVCDDCDAVIIGEKLCRRCADVRRMLPQYVQSPVGRAYVEQLLAELRGA